MSTPLDFSHPILSARRGRLAAELAACLDDRLLLVAAGEPVPLPEDTDQTYPFRAHSDYFYLTELDQPGGVVAFDPRSAVASDLNDGWRSFVPEITESERIWEGRDTAPGEPLGLLAGWLAARRGRPVVTLGAPLPGVRGDPETTQRVGERFRHARRPKDAREIGKLRAAAQATAAGYAALPAHLRPGVTERHVQIELEAAFFRAGATDTGYGSIVGSGPNSAVFHGLPGPRALQAGDFVLIDAGAAVDRYVCDVTRTFVVGREPAAFQRDLYQAVLSVQEATLACCRPGVEWKGLHLQVALQLTQALVDLGFLRGRAESLFEQEAYSLFFPHGLGHMVGLGVRDAPGHLPGRRKDSRPSLQSLRTDLPLQSGYVMTVEPGLYLVPALLRDRARRERFRDQVNWARVDPLIGLGGVRIEDNVLITPDGPEVLTAAIPKALTFS